MVDYSPLWDTMRKRGITQYMMLQDKILDNHTLDRLKTNRISIPGILRRADFSIIMRIHQYGCEYGCEYEPKRLDKSIAV